MIVVNKSPQHFKGYLVYIDEYRDFALFWVIDEFLILIIKFEYLINIERK